MVSIKVKFKPPVKSGYEGLIYYQIIYDRKIRRIMTDLAVRSDEWLEQHAAVIPGSDKTRHGLVDRVRKAIARDIERLNIIADHLADERSYFTADDIVDAYDDFKERYIVTTYIESIITRLKTAGKVRTAETYRATLNSIKRFAAQRLHDQPPLMVDQITPPLMAEYQAWLLQNGLVLNTVSFYMRILRAVYNRAVDSGAIKDRHPFRHIYTGIDTTVKRALPLKIIKKIKSADLTERPALALARDIFLMSFYLRGMSFIDMAFLRKTDLHDGFIRYRRRKTGQMLVIRWTKEMQDIVNRHPARNTEYLLPLIGPSATNLRCAYRNAGYNINHNLKILAGMLNIKIPLTLYVARHSWATAAKTKGIPINVISEGMGHRSEATTRIYLATIDTSVIDNANALIISSL